MTGSRCRVGRRSACESCGEPTTECAHAWTTSSAWSWKRCKRAGIYDDTLIFFFSDHGDFTGDYGLVEKTQNTFQDCLTRVPLLVKPPAGTPVSPRVSDALVELIDFPATVYALTGIEAGYDHFGRSLLPLLAGESDSHRDAVFCEGGRRRGERQCMETGEQRQTRFPLLAASTPADRRRSGNTPRLPCAGPQHTSMSDDSTSRTNSTTCRPTPARRAISSMIPAYGDVLATLKERMLQWYMGGNQ